MSIYEKTLYDVIHNMNGCVYYRLIIDGVSHFDRFVEQLERLPNERKSLKKVLALMERYSPSILLPKERFRQIKGLKREDVYEFKDPPCARVYVVIQKPNIYLVDGSTKNTQEATISRVGRLLKDFKVEDL